MKKIFFLALAAALFLSSCEKNKDLDKSGIFKGPETTVYHGTAWTWVKLNKAGTPEQVAIALDDEVLNSVTQGTGGGGHQHENHIELKFHPKADATIFKHLWLNWNPDGHPPVGVYNKPHFDFHFYMVSPEVRATFLDPAKLDAMMPPAYLPANHIGVDPVPAMGRHYVDVTSPELNGQPFTQTFIYGSYDARMVFMEPMITLDFLLNTQNFDRVIPQPEKFHQTGYYPTKMRVTKSNGVTNIILEGFVLRQAS